MRHHVDFDEVPGRDIDFYSSERLYALFERLSYIDAVLAAPTRVAFSTSVPLTGRFYMPAMTVITAPDFVPAPNPMAGASCRVKLKSDGIHVPTFSGFELDPSAPDGGWLRTAGTAHIVTFTFDGSKHLFTVYPL